MIEMKNDRASRTVRVRMSGAVSLEEMVAADKTLRAMSDEYRGALHVVLADMRGFRPLAPEVAEVMGAGIAYTRRRGVVHCAHLSDSSIVRLQAARLVREAVVGDPAITEVVSLEEAERVLEEVLSKLPPPR
jgi:hypothetical protein